MRTTTTNSAWANAWLNALGNELPDEYIILPEEGPKRARERQRQAASGGDGAIALEAYPNPASGEQWLVYQLPEGAMRGTVVVRDALGRETSRLNATSAMGILELPVSTWPSGLLSATLLADGIPVGMVKLIVQR